MGVEFVPETASLLRCRVGIQHSTVEVRFQDLAIETDVFVGSRALPTVTNAFLDCAQVCFLPPMCVPWVVCMLQSKQSQPTATKAFLNYAQVHSAVGASSYF